MNHKHGANCGCSNEVGVDSIGVLYNLYSRIDLENLECLNESKENSGKLCFRPWEQRNDKDKVGLA